MRGGLGPGGHVDWQLSGGEGKMGSKTWCKIQRDVLVEIKLIKISILNWWYFARGPWSEVPIIQEDLGPRSIVMR